MALKRWNKLNEKVLFQNKHWTYKLDQFEIEGVVKSEYHYVHSPGSTMVIPKLNNLKILLTNQFRYLNQKESLEFPCGSIDGNLTREQNALKELREETGYRAGQMTKLHEFWMSPGILKERMHLYLATELSPGEQALDVGERIEPIIATLDDAMTMTRDGRIQDAKTLVALLYYATFGKSQADST